jgi:hypothetical protein
LSYDSESWTVRRTYERRLITEEMHFMRRTAELRISQITEFTEQYRRNWKEHNGRISSDRIPKDIQK